jgi:hypothetical protein
MATTWSPTWTVPAWASWGERGRWGLPHEPRRCRSTRRPHHGCLPGLALARDVHAKRGSPRHDVSVGKDVALGVDDHRRYPLLRLQSRNAHDGTRPSCRWTPRTSRGERPPRRCRTSRRRRQRGAGSAAERWLRRTTPQHKRGDRRWRPRRAPAPPSAVQPPAGEAAKTMRLGTFRPSVSEEPRRPVPGSGDCVAPIGRPRRRGVRRSSVQELSREASRSFAWPRRRCEASARGTPAVLIELAPTGIPAILSNLRFVPLPLLLSRLGKQAPSSSQGNHS